jgi:hypothetical protein
MLILFLRLGKGDAVSILLRKTPPPRFRQNDAAAGG